MVEVRPLRGLRYDVTQVDGLAQVLCPPYDVISPREAAELRARSLWNAIHLELPEPAPSLDRYQQAAALLSAWQEERVLRREEQPTWYAIEEQFEWQGQPHRRRGVLAGVRLAAWDENVVLPHERTLAGPKADRLALLEACATNLSQVFLLHPPRAGAERAFWAAVEVRVPLAEVVLSATDRLRVWTVGREGDAWGAALADAHLYVADGHHRYETALRYRDDLRQAGAAVPRGAEYVLAYLVSTADPGLLLLPTHRCAPAAADRGALERLLAERFDVERVTVDGVTIGTPADALARLARQSAERLTLGVYTPGTLWLASPRANAARWMPAERHLSWRALDVAQADALVFQPLLGPAAAEQLTYTRDAAEALQRVDGGESAFAVLLSPLAAEQMAAVAEAHERMPQKSTYFYPKLPTGLLFHRLDAAALG